MFIHYCSVQCVFNQSPTCSVMTFMIYKTISLLQNKVMEVFRVLANKNYGIGRIKNHDLQRLIDPYALQDF